MKIYMNTLLLILLTLSCVPTFVIKEPEWIHKSLPPGYYRGVATCKQTEEDAINDARKDALKKILDELGIGVDVEYNRERTEENGKVNIIIKDRLYAKARGWIRGVREKEVYPRRRQTNEGYCYDAWVLVYIPEEEIKRAKEQLENYNKKVLEEAQKLMKKGETFEREGNYGRACIIYEGVNKLLNEVSVPEANILKPLVEEKLKALGKDISSQFIHLQGNSSIIEDVEMLRYPDGVSLPFYIPEGEKLYVQVVLKRNAYVYLINYDITNSEFRIVFPNEYHKNNLMREGIHTLPPSLSNGEDVVLVAEPPFGENYLKVIATYRRLDLPPIDDTPYHLLSSASITDILHQLRGSSFDAKNIVFYIEEGVDSEY